MNKPLTVLKQVNNELHEVTSKLDKLVDSHNLDSHINSTIDYLNDTIRSLDHAVEKLMESNNK